MPSEQTTVALKAAGYFVVRSLSLALTLSHHPLSFPPLLFRLCAACVVTVQSLHVQRQTRTSVHHVITNQSLYNGLCVAACDGWARRVTRAVVHLCRSLSVRAWPRANSGRARVSLTTLTAPPGTTDTRPVL